jgi:hypothetical protein
MSSHADTSLGSRDLARRVAGAGRGTDPRRSWAAPRSAVAIAIWLLAVAAMLLAAHAALAGQTSRHERPWSSEIVTPRAGALLLDRSVRVSVRLSPDVRSLRVTVGSRDISRAFIRHGRVASALLQAGRTPGLRFGHVTVFVRTINAGGRRGYNQVSFTLARRGGGLMRSAGAQAGCGQGASVHVACAVAASAGLAVGANASAGGPRAHVGAAYTMRFRVLDAIPERLTVQDRTLEKGHWRGDGPVGARYLGVADFVMESESNHAQGHIRWRIGESKYLLRVYGDANNGYADCSIQNLDRKDESSSPWECRIKTTGKKDWDTYVVLQPKDAKDVTYVDGNSRRQVYEALCGTAGVTSSGYVSCDVKVSDISRTTGPREQTGALLVNCGAGTLEQEIGWSRTSSEVDTLGGSVGVEYESPGKFFNGKIEVSYQHQWTSSRTWSQSTSLVVPADHYGWVDVASPQLTVTASITAIAGNQKYVLPDVAVSQPLREGPAIAIGQSAALPRNYCDGSSRAELPLRVGPPQIDSMSVYGIGRYDANQRVLTAPPSSDSADPIGLSGSGPDTRQLWQLQTVRGYLGYYRIRSDRNLNQCLDGDIAQSTVIQYSCKSDSNSTIKNQLWKLVWNADSTGFELENNANGTLIGVDDAGTGLKLIPRGTRGVPATWQLNGP